MQVGRRLAGMSLMRFPLSRMSPELAVSMPARMRTSVVLPLPDGPTIVKNSPSLIPRSIRSTAVSVPKTLLTAASSRIGRDSPCGGFTFGSRHDVQKLGIVGYDVILDGTRHLLLQAVPLNGVELVRREQ